MKSENQEKNINNERYQKKAVQTSGARMLNLDLLRCLAMMMIIVLHYLGKGGLLGDVTAANMGAVGTVAWILEAFSIVAVNSYMLISGYFLCESSFRLSRLLQLYLQVWSYSVILGMLAAALGILPAAEADTHYFLTLLFPVSMRHYWFMTAYVFLYLLLPLLAMAVRNMSKRQLSLVLTVLLTVFCVLKSVLPFRLETDSQGYDCLWYICVFLTAAYIRKFGMPFLESGWRCACLYAGGCIALFGELMILRQVYLRTGSMELILKTSYDYNHVLPVIASVGLFGLFLEMKSDKGHVLGGAAGKAAPYVLGVYLLHENMGLRYSWQNWFGADRIQTVPQLLVGTVSAVACVFATGVIVERLRTLLMRGIHSLLLRLGCYQKLMAVVERVDESWKKD